MNPNENQGNRKPLYDDEILNYVEKKRRIQQALEMAQEAERKLDREMEEALKQRVADGQKAHAILKALHAKRITGTAPQTAPPTVSYSTQQTSVNVPSGKSAARHPQPSSSAGGPYISYSSNGHHQQSSAQNSGKGQLPSTSPSTNMYQGVAQNTPAGPSQTTGGQAAPARMGQPQTQYPSVPMQNFVGSFQQGSTQQPIAIPFQYAYHNGMPVQYYQPGSYQYGVTSQTIGGTAPGTSHSQGPPVANGGFRVPFQQWQTPVVNNGVPMDFGVNQTSMQHDHGQVSPQTQRNTSSTLDGALGPKTTESSNYNSSSSAYNAKGAASIGIGAALQELPRNSTSTNQNLQSSVPSVPPFMVSKSTIQLGSNQAQVPKNDSTPAVSTLAAKGNEPGIGTTSAANIRNSSSIPLHAQPPSRFGAEGFPNMQDIQDRAKTNEQNAPKSGTFHVRSQTAAGDSRPTPHDATSLVLPFAPRRVFVPPSASAATSSRPGTPQRKDSESTPPVTPASAKKKTLARDILFALGMGSRKRKSRSDEEVGSASELEQPANKKFATETHLSDDERQNETEQPKDERIPTYTTSISSSLTSGPLPPPMTGSASASADIDPIAAISADIAQVVSEVQSSTSTPSEFITLEEPTIIELPAGDNIAAFQPEGATIVELPDDESEATVEIGLTTVPPEMEPQSRSSSTRMSPIFEPIDESAGPLFLPSPGPGSDIADVDECRSADVTEAGPSRLPLAQSVKARRFREVYVEVPPLPPWAGEARSITGVAANIASVVVPAKPLEEAKKVVEDAETLARKYTTAEVMKESMSRLHQRLCHWPDCVQSFNTAYKLQHHVADHIKVGPEPVKGIFSCNWVGCVGRSFNNDHAFLKHTRNHVARLQQCSVVDCDEKFSHPESLAAHLEKDHPKPRNLRPDEKPFHHVALPRLPKLPRIVAAYATAQLEIRPSCISKERHEEIGPRVLKRIFGPVNLDIPRSNARFPLRAAQQHQNATVQPKKHDEFDFLSASRSRPFSDIPASFISDIVEANVLMTPIEGAPQGEFEEIIIASDRLPNESYDASGREEDVSVESGVDIEAKDESGEMSSKGAPQDADEDSGSESAVDGLV